MQLVKYTTVIFFTTINCTVGRKLKSSNGGKLDELAVGGGSVAEHTSCGVVIMKLWYVVSS